MELHPEVAALAQRCTALRQALHQIPETGFEERETQAFLRAELEKTAPDRLEEIAKTGLKAVFFAKGASETIAFRADIDALNTREQNTVDYVSCHEGKMHGCGHDGHMTILLLLAGLIARHRDRLKQNVVLLFQPGEEGYGGAKVMIQDGALENPKVDRIYGLHVWPSLPKGKLGIRWGPMMAQTLEFDILVQGRSAHGASPQMGIDAVVVAAELIGMLQTAITRNVDPHEDALLTIGKIQGGTARNIIADSVELNATLRVFSPEVYRRLFKRIQYMTDGLSVATGAKFTIRRLMHYPCVNNPRPLVENFYTYLDSMEDVVLVEPAMAAEDFACYQEQVPGLFFFLGIGGGKNSHPLHNAQFDFDEDALLLGVEVYRRLLGLQ